MKLLSRLGSIPAIILIWIFDLSTGTICSEISKSFDSSINIIFLRHAISLMSHNVREEYTIHIQNAAPADSGHYIQYFDFLLPKSKVDNLAYLTGYSEMLNPNDTTKEPRFEMLKRLEVPQQVYLDLIQSGHK